MLSASSFRDLVSGRRRGMAPAALRTVLRVAEAPYTWAVNRRNRRFDRAHAIVHRVAVPVVSVGNLTLGGTGKTPMVKWLARHLLQQHIRLAIVSRGYRAAAGEQNDEAMELAAALPDVPHVQNPDRFAAATRAVREFGAELILLDDGFQHRRLARDLDIVLLDALEPFGFEHVFPRGTLREPVAGLSRAHVVCLSRADVLPHAEREALRRRVHGYAPHVAWCELAHVPSRLIDAAGRTLPLEALAGRQVLAFSGIGNPRGFRHTLERAGCHIRAWREFPDHHAFSDGDLSELERLAKESELAVCTHKDLVKLARTRLGETPLSAVEIEMRFLAGQEALERALASVIRRAAATTTGAP